MAFGASVVMVASMTAAMTFLGVATAPDAAADSAACTPDPGYTGCTAFSYNGADQTFTVPANITAVKIKSWGAGGGGVDAAYSSNQAGGGGGGYATGTLAVTPGQNLTVVVGQAGSSGTNGSLAQTYGGGGAGGSHGSSILSSKITDGGSGGGASAVFVSAAKLPGDAVLVAGGGGGASPGATLGTPDSGGGGGITGGQASDAATSGRGGSQTAGGAAATAATNCSGTQAGSAQGGAGTTMTLQGGNGGSVSGNTSLTPNEGGGGGGGGWFGGGGGACQKALTVIPTSDRNGTGGGGSSYLGGAGLTASSTVAGTNGTYGTPGTAGAAGNNADSQYVAGVGAGGSVTSTGGGNAGNGLVVLEWSLGYTIVKSASAFSTTPGGTITYKLVITNTSSSPYTVAAPAGFSDNLAGVLDDATYNNDAASTVSGWTFTGSGPLVGRGPLAAGQVATITYSVTVKSPDTGDKSLVNTITPTKAEGSCGASCSTSTPVITAATVCATAVTLPNGSFEAPTINAGAGTNLSGGSSPLTWGTTATDNAIELWRNGGNVQSANGGLAIAAQDGSQWAELNANRTGALYQDITTIPGQVLRWSVWHRARYVASSPNGRDVMAVQIGSTTSQADQVPYGQSTSQISDTGAAWVNYTGLYNVPQGQSTTRFQFAAVSTITGNTSYGNFIDNVTLGNSPCLLTTKSVTNLTAGAGTLTRPGDVLKYTVTATNNGGDATASTSLSDAIPAGTTYVPGSLTAGGVAVTDAAGDDTGNFTNNTVTARLGTGATASQGGAVAVGAVVTMTFQVKVNADTTAGTVLANTANASYTWPPSTNTLTGISNTVTTPVSTTTIALVKSLDSTVDTNGNGRVDTGDQLKYAFKVTNTGSVPLTGVGVTDSKVGSVSCPQTSLAVGAQVICTATYTVTAADATTGSIVNTATASGTPTGGSAAISSSQSTVTTPVQVPSLSLTKTPSSPTVATLGQNTAYTIVVRNTGNTSLAGVTVADTLTAPAGPSPDSFSCTVTQPATLAPGDSYTCTSNYAVKQTDLDNGKILDTATVSGTPPQGTAVTATAGATVTVTANPVLTIVKTATPTTVTAPGQNIGYSFAVKNTGNQTVSGITVVDTFSAPAAPSPAPVITCTATTLAPGAGTTCTSASYSTTQADIDNGKVVDSAVAKGTGATGVAVTSAPSTATVTATASPAVTITNTAAPTVVTALGQQVTFTYTAKNTGNVTLSAATVSNAIALPGGPNPAVSCTPTSPIAAFAPGATATCAAVYTATQADLDNGRIVDTATISANPPTGAAVTATAPVTVTTAPTRSVRLTKTAGVSTVTAAGNSVTYTFTVTNNGATSITSFAVTDALTAPAAPVPTVTCPADTGLAPGASKTCSATYTARQADIDFGSITDTGSVTATVAGGQTVTDTSTVVVNATPTSSLTLTKSASPTTITAAGQSITYSFLVTNTGTATLSGLAIADAFTAPAGTVPTVTCPVTTLAPGAATTCSATYSATQADLDNGSVTNSATAAAKTAGNVTVTSNTSTATVAATRAPKLTITKTASPTTLTAAGQTVNYTFVVTNSGNTTVTGIAVTDTFGSPAGPGSPVVCGSTALAPGAGTTCTSSYVATQADVDKGSIGNSAVATGADPARNVVTSAAAGATVAITRSPALTLLKTASRAAVTASGQQITYSFAVTNSGNTTITAITVADSFTAPAGAGASAITCPSTSLAPGAGTTCTGTYTAAAADLDAGSISNTATASGKDPQNATVNSAASTATVSATQAAALSLDRTIDQTALTGVGERITYTYTLTNTGNVTITNAGIAISLQAPAGPNPPVICPTTTIPAGGSITCTTTYTVTQADIDYGSYRSASTATGKDPNGVTVTSNTKTYFLVATQTPSLSLVKSASQTTISGAGQSIGYSFLVKNTGNVTITGVTIADAFTPPAGPVPAITCPTSTLAPNVSTTCTGSYLSSQADADAGVISNSATASGKDPNNAAVSSAASTATVAVTQISALTVTKTASPTTVNSVGQVVSYSFAVTNTGNVTVTALAIADTFNPAVTGATSAISCPSRTLAPGAGTTCSGTYTVTQADLDAGSIKNSAVASATNPQGRQITSAASAATVTATQSGKLALTKTANRATFTQAGQSIGYSFAVSNTGNVTVTGLSVADTFAGPASSTNATAISCAATTLAPGAATTCTGGYTTSAADLANLGVSNTAVAGATDPSGKSVSSNASTVTVTVPTSVGLSLTKSASPATVSTLGQLVTYTFAVSNTGSLPVSALAVTDTFAAPAAPGGAGASAISCQATSLDVGESTTCTGTYAVGQADLDKGSIDNSAVVNGTPSVGQRFSSNTSSASVSVNQSARLTVGNTATPNSLSGAVTGQTVNYSFPVTNTGNVTVSTIALTDSFTAPGGPVPTITCDRTTVAPLAVAACTASYTVTQADVDAGTIKNAVGATGRDPAGNTVTAPAATSTVTVNQTTGLNLVKVANRPTVSAAGQIVVYQFGITNTGNTTAGALAVDDVFAAPAGPTPAISCSSSTAAPGVTVGCVALYTATQADLDAGSIFNTATAAGRAPNGATITSAPSSVTVGVAGSATLALTASTSTPSVATVGQLVTYTFAVTNTGNQTVNSPGINDVFTTPPGEAAPSFACVAGVLGPGASTTCTGSHTVTQADLDAGTIVNTGTATGVTTAGAAVASNAGSTTVAVTNNAALTLVKTPTPTSVSAAGQSISYAFKVTNSGNRTITALAVTDTFTAPAGVGASAISCPTAPLAPAATVTCTGTYSAGQADLDKGSIANTAVVSGLDPQNGTVTSAPATATVTAAAAPALSIVKSGSPGTISAAGASVAYSFAVRNTGNVTVSSLTVNDAFTAPAGPALTVSCPVTSLAPDAATTCTAGYSATQADLDKGSIVNTATAVGRSPVGATVTSASSVFTVTAEQTSTLTLTNSAGPTTVSTVGQSVSYSFKATNTGNTTLSGLAIGDAFAAPGGPVPTISCPATSLLPGVSTTCTATYPVTQADIDNGSIVNTATATARNPLAVTVTSGSPVSTVAVTQTSSLTVVKSANPTTVSAVGTAVTYSFAVSNTGNTTITGIAVNDTLAAPAGPAVTVSCSSTVLAPGAGTTCTAPYSVTQADLTNGVISNSATVSGQSPTNTGVTSGASTATIAVTQTPQLGLTETAGPAAVTAVGQVITYTFGVTNSGNVPVTGLAVATSPTAPAGTTSVPVCATTSLAPGSGTTCTATYVTTQADLDRGSVVVGGIATARDPGNRTVTSPSASATVAASQTPAITLVQEASRSTVTAAGQTIDYSFTVRNNGNVTTSNLAITDTLVAPAGPALAITCPVTSLAPGASTTCTAGYTITHPDLNAGTIVNRATASATGPSGAPASSAQTSTTVGATQTPGLTVTKTASPTVVTAAGQTVAYSFLVRNTGNVTVTAVKINDTFSAPAGPVPSISCQVTGLLPGSTTTCSGNYTVTQADVDAGSISNSATASATTPTGGTVSAAASTATVGVTATAKLTVVNSVSPTSASAAGSVVSYSFVVTNTGNVTVTGLGVTDALSVPGDTAPTVTCPVTTLAPGAATTCTAGYPVTQADVDAGSLVNTAVANGAGAAGAGPVGSAPSASTLSIGQAPALTLVKAATPSTVSAAGQVVGYSFRVTNSGNVTIAGIGISDTFTAPAGPLGTVDCPVTTLAPGGVTTCTASYPSTQADIDKGSIANSAAATGTAPGSVPVTSPVSQFSVGVAQTPSLTVVKTADVTSVSAAGAPIRFSFAVNNTGNVTLSLLSIQDQLAAPAGPAVQVDCPSRTLAPGGAATCTGSYTVTQADLDAGSVSNTATASAQDPGGRTVNSTGPGSVSTVSVGQAPALQVVTSSTPGTVSAVGQRITYTYTVTNNGNVTDSALAIAPAFTGPAGPGSAVNCQSTSLAPGASTTCTSTYVVTQADLDAGSVINTPAGTAKDPKGNPVGSPAVPVTVPVQVNAALSLLKTANPLRINNTGDVVSYSFAVGNTGNVTVSGLTVADTFAAPAGQGAPVSCPTDILAPGAGTVCTSTYTATQDDVAAGSVSNTAVAAALTPLGAPLSSPSSTAFVNINQDAALQLTLTATPTVVTTVGQLVQYSYTLTNTGNLAVDTITVGAAAGSEVGGTPTCSATAVNPGASVTCTLSYQVTQDDLDRGSITDLAVANGTARGQTPAPVASNAAAATVTATRAAALTLSASTTVASYDGQNQSIGYTFHVSNTGNQTVTDLSIANTLNSPAAPQLSISCPVTTLAPGAATDCTATYLTTLADMNAGAITGLATAGGTDPSGAPVSSGSDRTSVAAIQRDAGSVTQTANPTTVSKAGDVITYTFVAVNSGNVTLSNAEIQDTLSAPAGPPLSIACPTLTLDPGGSTTCTAQYVVTQADVDAGSVTNTNVVSAVAPDGIRRSTPPSVTTVTIAPAPVLSITKSGAPATVSAVGQSVSYTFVVRNTGNVTVNNLAVADTFTAPAGPELAVSCPDSMLAPNASTTCSGTYSVTQADLDAGSIANSAVAQGTTPGGAGYTSDPSTFTVTASRSPLLSLVQTAAPARITGAGQQVQYSFAVVNTGNVTVSGLGIADSFSTPGDVVPAITCQAVTLAPGAGTVCTGTAPATQADIDAGAIVSTATASGSGAGGTPVTSNVSVATVNAQQGSSLKLVTTVDRGTVTTAGTVVHYTFAVTNTGNTTLTGLTIDDSATAPATPPFDIFCTATTLVPGASTTCTADYIVNQADIDKGSIRDSGTARATDPAAATVVSPASNTTVLATRASAITVVKSATMTTVAAVGQQIPYRFVVTNTGNLTLSNISVADNLAAPAGPEIAVGCPVSSLAPAGTTTCTGTYTVTQADLDNGSVDNAATVRATDTRGLQVGSGISTATVGVAQTGSLALVEVAAPTSYDGPGQTVNYTFRISNTGNVAVSGLSVADTSGGRPFLTVSCPPSVAAGATVTCTASQVTSQQDVDNGSIVDVSVATGRTPLGAPVTSAPAGATVTAVRAPALTVVNSAVPGTVSAVGQVVTYSVLVSNTGNTTVTGISVTDTVAAPGGTSPSISCPSSPSALAPGDAVTCTGTYAVVQADLDNGSITATAAASGTAAGGAAVLSDTSVASVTAARAGAIALVSTTSTGSVSAVGDTVTYTFTATNNGNTTLTGLRIDSALTAPAGPALVITCPNTPIAPGDSAACTAIYTVTQADLDAGEIAESATASAVDPGGVSATSAPFDTAVGVTENPGLTIAIAATPDPYSTLGQGVTYTFTVTNTGNVTLTNPSIGASLVSPAGPPVTPTCPDVSVAPGATVNCTAVYRVNQADLDAGAIVISASAGGRTPGGVLASSSPVSATVTASATSALAVSRSSSALLLTTAGAQVTFTYTVTNTGTVTLFAVAVTDTMTAPGGPSPTVTCPGTAVAPGATVTCTAVYTVTQADMDNGRLDSTLGAQATDPGGAVITSPSVPASIGAGVTVGLSLAESVSQSTISAPGQVLTYIFEVTNNGNQTVSGVFIGDEFDTATGPQMHPLCASDTIAPASSVICTSTHTVTQADLDNGSIGHSSGSTARTPDGRTVISNFDGTTVLTSANDALTLATTVDRPTYGSVGELVTYTYTLTNAGNVTLSGPAVQATSGGAAMTVSCPAGALAPGDSTICTSSHRVTQADLDAGSIVETGTAAASDPFRAPVSSRPSVTTVTGVDVVGLSMTESVSPASYSAAGTTLAYTFTVTNTSNVTVSGVAIGDVFTSPAGPALTPTCGRTTLAPGASTVCTASYTSTQADQDAGQVADRASATGTSATGKTVGSNATTASAAAVQSPALAVSATASTPSYDTVGQQITFDYVVTNTGNVTLSGAIVPQAFLPAGGPPVPAVCPPGSFAPGASATCTSVYTVTQADLDNGSLSVTVPAAAKDPGGATVNSTATDTVTLQAITSRSLTLSESTSTSTVSAVGDPVVYTFTVTNAGSTTVTGVAIASVFNPTGPSLAPVCAATTLAPGEVTTCTATYLATQTDLDAGTITDHSVATGSGGVGSNPTSATVTVTAQPGLTIAQTASRPSVSAAGDQITYTFTVTNTGNVTVDNLLVGDTMPAPAGPAPTVTCASTSVAPGASVTCTAVYTVKAGDLDLSNISNTASASGSTPAGGAVSSQIPSTTSVLVQQQPGLSIVTTATPRDVNHDGRISQGDTVSWTFTVTNTGNTSVSGVVVTDPKAGRVTCPSATLAAGASEVCTAQPYRVTVADAVAGRVDTAGTATGRGPAGQVVRSAPSAVTTPVVGTPGLALTKSAGALVDANHDGLLDAGDTISYTFTVTNTGSEPLSAVGVSDSLLHNVSCSPSRLAPGQHASCVAAPYAVTQDEIDAGVVSGEATATGVGPQGQVSSNAAATSTPLARKAALTLRKTGTVTDANGDGRTDAGDTVRWNFLVTNTGNTVLTGVTVHDPAAGRVDCAHTTLDPAAGTSCHAAALHTVTAAEAAAGVISNVATAGADCAAGTGCATVVSVEAAARISVSLPPAPILTVVVQPVVTDANGNGITDPGDVVNWTVVVTNNGTVPVADLSLTDPALGQITCPATILAAGTSVTCTAPAHPVTQADADAGRISTSATAAGTGPGGRGVTAVSPVAVVRVQQTPAAGPPPVPPSGQPPVPPPGGSLSYTGGGPLLPLTVAALAALLFGFSLLLVGRRRRRG